MIGVILLNLGGPDSLRAVKPFLYNLFSDRDIIRLGPSFLQKPIASLIANLRAKKTIKAYSMIGGKSPILDITTAQARDLEKSLNSSLVTRHSSLSFKVYIGMRYWHPYIEDTVEQMHNDGVRKIIALSLYPHYCIATTGSSVKKLREALTKIYRQDITECSEAKNESSFTVHCITSWFNHPIYIDALVDGIKKGLESFSSELRTARLSSPKSPISELKIPVLFSAHSLPKKFIGEGDPYVNETRGTIEEITKKLNIDWYLSYQSKSGPVKWLEPSTEEMLYNLAQKGAKNLLVVPISFVSDHIETLYEIDIIYKKMAQGLGINLKRTESMNTSPKFIEALADMVIKRAYLD